MAFTTISIRWFQLMVVITEKFFIVSLCCLLSKRGLRELFRTQFPKMSDVLNSWYLVFWPFLFLEFDFLVGRASTDSPLSCTLPSAVSWVFYLLVSLFSSSFPHLCYSSLFPSFVILIDNSSGSILYLQFICISFKFGFQIVAPYSMRDLKKEI